MSRRLGKKDEAEALWRQLIQSNPENKRYFAGLLNLLGITEQSASSSAAVELFKGLQADHPKSTAAKRLALVHATATTSKVQATAYAKNALVKGVPSLSPISNPSTPTRPSRLRSRRLSSRCVSNGLPPRRLLRTVPTHPPRISGRSYYLASTTRHRLLRPRTAIHRFGHSALLHAPRTAHVCARASSNVPEDHHGASSAMSDARLLDGKTLPQQQSCQVPPPRRRPHRSERIVGLFTKPDAPSPVYDLNEMQALWYLAEDSESHLRAENWAMALKRVTQLEKVFRSSGMISWTSTRTACAR